MNKINKFILNLIILFLLFLFLVPKETHAYQNCPSGVSIFFAPLPAYTNPPPGSGVGVGVCVPPGVKLRAENIAVYFSWGYGPMNFLTKSDSILGCPGGYSRYIGYKEYDRAGDFNTWAILYPDNYPLTDAYLCNGPILDVYNKYESWTSQLQNLTVEGATNFLIKEFNANSLNNNNPTRIGYFTGRIIDDFNITGGNPDNNDENASYEIRNGNNVSFGRAILGGDDNIYDDNPTYVCLGCGGNKTFIRPTLNDRTNIIRLILRPPSKVYINGESVSFPPPKIEDLDFSSTIIYWQPVITYGQSPYGKIKGRIFVDENGDLLRTSTDEPVTDNNHPDEYPQVWVQYRELNKGDWIYASDTSFCNQGPNGPFEINNLLPENIYEVKAIINTPGWIFSSFPKPEFPAVDYTAVKPFVSSCTFNRSNSVFIEGEWLNDEHTAVRVSGFDFNPNQVSYLWFGVKKISSPTPSESPTPSPTPTSSPWFQTQEGDVYAKGEIYSKVPENDYFSLNGSGGFPGLVSYGEDATFAPGEVSQKGWLVKSSFEDYFDYDYFYQLVGFPHYEETEEEISLPEEKDIVAYNGDFKTGFEWNVGTRKMVVLINGKFLIKNLIEVEPGGSLLVIAKGGIGVSKDVSSLTGLFFTDGDFYSSVEEDFTQGFEDKEFVSVTSDSQLILNGSVYAQNFVLERDLGSTNENPSEKFVYRPDFLLNLHPSLLLRSRLWQEEVP